MFDDSTTREIERLADKAVRAPTEADPNGPANARASLVKAFRSFGDLGETLCLAYLNDARARAARRNR